LLFRLQAWDYVARSPINRWDKPFSLLLFLRNGFRILFLFTVSENIHSQYLWSFGTPSLETFVSAVVELYFFSSP
jgi:hypothetical protein